jgi:cell division protein FtsN
MRRNLTRLKGEVKADTDIGRTYPLFKFGMADWSAIATEEIGGKADTRLNLSLGAMIAGGEATAALYYNSTGSFSERQQRYLWRYVNNDFKPLRQVMVGKIATQAISSIFNSVVGIQFTNTPTTFRRSFGSYTLSDKTEPGWIVELYINNILVDYIKADASGFFTFEVPLVYGNSIVKLKYFGPWGEERTLERNIIIPFNFLPPKTMEYTVGAGIVEDSLMSRFSRASINYGVTRNLTIGGGAEYLSSLPANPLMPFANASLRLTNNFLVTGEYTYGVRAKGTLTYRMPSNIQLDLNYTWYDKDQKAIFYNYWEERRATVSMPLRIGKLSSYQRFSVYQIIFPGAKYITSEWMFSGSLFGVNTNLSTYGMFLSDADPSIYSTLSLAFRLPAGFIVMPQIQFGYTPAEFVSAKMRVEKPILNHAYLNLSYEQNFRNHLNLAELGFRYDFSFAQTGLSVRQSNKTTSFVQYARGSLINDSKTKFLGTDNRTNVGRGGISIVPYLDLNSNRQRDPGEPKAYGLNLHTNGGRVEKSVSDTTIRILGLEPYTDCYVELDPNSFDNISWRLGKKTLSVSVDPNSLKLVEIPVIIAGEANGTVTLKQDGIKKGLGRIIISFIKSGGKPAGKTLSEEDGFFSYFGLEPGEYDARIDTAQLRKLGMISTPESLHVSIAGGIDGDIVDGLDFTLRTKPGDTTTVEPVLPEKPVIRKDTSFMIIHEVVEELVIIAEDSWAIQLGAFIVRSNAEKYRKTLEKLLGKQVNIVIEGGYYKVRIPDLKTREEVDENIAVLKKNGVTELWVIRLIGKRQQLVLTEKQDTIVKITEISTEPAEQSFRRETSIEVGTFKNINNAIALKDTLFSSLYKPILIIRQDGYYKVRITGFESNEEIDKFIPSLVRFGLKKVLIPSVGKSEDKLIEIQSSEEIKPDTTKKVTEIIPQQPVAEEAPVVKEPTIALQVGVFHNKNQALRAQKRITSKLNLPVEIITQWDYYHVIVTGFFTREETYRYYPELAGLGYPGVTVIENYKRQQ